MGLRETNAERTRQLIVDVAVDLFIEHGYDTTMEQIAEQAGVGSSTLYRYFPSKDLLILDPLIRAFDLASLLRERPADEPLAATLGEVVVGGIEGDERSMARIRALRKVIDVSPSPRARLWDFMVQSQRDLQDALAERVQRDPEDLEVAFTARMVIATWELAGSRWSDGDHRASRTDVVRQVLDELGTIDLVLPSLSVRAEA